MAAPASVPTLLCISGSLRRQSYATAVLNTIIERVGERAQPVRFDIGSLPHYNADLDTDAPPPAVAALKQAVAAASGVVIVTPEYNYSLPGVLKNTIDWASRPGYRSVFRGKPVLVVSVSGGALGGVRAQQHLKAVLGAMLARTFVWEEIVVPNAGEKTKDGRLAHAATEDFLMAAVVAFLESL